MIHRRLQLLSAVHVACSIFLTKAFVFPSHGARPCKAPSLSALYGAESTASMTSNLHAKVSPYQVSISYCTGCRWGLRGFWMAQELLTTFQDDANLQAVTVQPSSEAGTFEVRCHIVDADRNVDVVLWDRKERGRFPEMKEIKQLLRDEVEPTRFLGHSDTETRKHAREGAATDVSDEPLTKSSFVTSSLDFEYPQLMGTQSSNVAVVYCTGCKWLFRATWFAQEFLQAFEDEIRSISLLPSRSPFKGGTFQVRLNGAMVWDRATQGEFPDIKVAKQMLRDRLSPGRELGHTEQKQILPFVEMDDDEAEEARRLFGIW